MAHRTAALVVAAGKGLRSGSAVPKQFAPLGGRPMLDWSVAALSAHPAIDEVLVASRERLAQNPHAVEHSGAPRRRSGDTDLDEVVEPPLDEKTADC